MAGYVRVLIPESVSGTGKGVYNNTAFTFITKKVSAVLNEKGKIVITGTDLVDVNEWIYTLTPAALESWFKAVQRNSEIQDPIGVINWKDIYLKLHWTDILAFSLLSGTKGLNPYTKLQSYHSGNNNYVYPDETKILMWIKDIYRSAGTLDYNKLIDRDFPEVPDDSTQADSPFNPKSPLFDLSKPIYTYDPDFGYVLYKSGEVLWNKTGGQYFDAANGQIISYDKANGTVQFSSGNILNLVTLELVKPDNGKVVINNIKPWYIKFFTNLLTDTKTQYTVLAVLAVILLIKKKKSDED